MGNKQKVINDNRKTLNENKELTNNNQELVNKIFDELKYVLDPELGINIVDLGLVYKISINNNVAKIKMTLTSPICPLNEQIENEVIDRALEYVDGAKVEWTFSPPWDKSMISIEGQELMKAMGHL
jgi:metal-sulfur cluster biosynthetic enzyme